MRGYPDHDIRLIEFAWTGTFGWPVDAVVEQNVTGLRARVMKITHAGLWVRRLTKAGALAQKKRTAADMPIAFNLAPVIAINEWHYTLPRGAAPKRLEELQHDPR